MQVKKVITACTIVVIMIFGVIILIRRNMQWDSISVYCGLNREDVLLSAHRKAELSDFVWNFAYSKLDDDSTRQSAIYGGEFFTIEFQSGDVTHKWFITNRQIRHSVYEDGKETESYVFEGSELFITQMKEIIYP